MNREFAVLAHKTCYGNAPSNSWRGLLAAWHYGVPRVECDVKFSKDGAAFIWSSDMNRFLHGVHLENLTSAEIGLLRRSDCGEKVMRVSDVLKFLSLHQGIDIEFDVKYYDWDIIGHLRTIPKRIIDFSFEKIVKPALESNLGNRIGFVTFFGGLNLLRMARLAAPEISTGLIVVSPKWSLGDLDDKGLVCPRCLTMGWKTVNHWQWFSGDVARIVAQAKINGLRIYAGLAANEKDLRWAWDKGFDAAWVDDRETFPIPRALEIVDKLRRLNS